MMARRGVLSVLIGGLAAMGLSGCGSTERLRYKMTVEIETPEGLRSGSTVRELTLRTPPSIPMLGEDKGTKRVRGEAVAVDLPGGQTLFALLNGANGSDDYAAYGIDTLLKEHGGSAPHGVVELWPAMPETRAPRIGNPLPLLVIFRDINDPATVAQVDPANLSAVLGPRVKLRRITVELTRDPINRGIEKRLPWLPALHGGYLHGKASSIGAPLGLHGGNFSSEMYK